MFLEKLCHFHDPSYADFVRANFGEIAKNCGFSVIPRFATNFQVKGVFWQGGGAYAPRVKSVGVEPMSNRVKFTQTVSDISMMLYFKTGLTRDA